MAHDLGHPPFGHAGERAIDAAVRRYGQAGWNANVHSLDVVDRVEVAFVDFVGLNLTWATREGIARHATPFDEPMSFGEFLGTPNAGLECQIVDLADIFAYLSHDLDDALAGDYVDAEELRSHSIVRDLLRDAEEKWDRSTSRPWADEERATVTRKRVIATLLARLIDDSARESQLRIESLSLDSPRAVRECADRAVTLGMDHERLVHDLLRLLTDKYYRSTDVADADEAASDVVSRLVDYFVVEPEHVPQRFRRGDEVMDAATYVASLNDFTAAALADAIARSAAH